jgi:hypothetical protein
MVSSDRSSQKQYSHSGIRRHSSLTPNLGVRIQFDLAFRLPAKDFAHIVVKRGVRLEAKDFCLPGDSPGQFFADNAANY